jgi:hypothetical protein
MTTRDIAKTLATLFAELVEGTPPSGGYMLNAGDRGLLQSLDRLSADAASTPTRHGSSIAAHVEHVRYGLSLMNRWSAGENPFGDADWGAAWRKTHLSEAEWGMLRDQLRHEATRWLEALRTPREVDEEGLNGMIGSIAHLAYHVGAIRQIDQLASGPPDKAR